MASSETENTVERHADEEIAAMSELAAAWGAVPPEGRERVLLWLVAYAYGAASARVEAFRPDGRRVADFPSEG